MKKCGYNCDDCPLEICIEGGQDANFTELTPEEIDDMEARLRYWFSYPYDPSSL